MRHYRNLSGKCCSPLLLQEVLSQNIGICSYFLYAPCKFPCFITDTENLGRSSAILLHDQCLLAQETKSKLSVVLSGLELQVNALLKTALETFEIHLQT